MKIVWRYRSEVKFLADWCSIDICFKNLFIHWRWLWFTDIIYRRVDWKMNLRRPRILVLPGAYEINVWPLTLTIFHGEGRR